MSVLFTNVRILDGTGAQPYAGDVLVEGSRIARVGRGVRALSLSGVTVIDGAGATLMPGMVEAHTHFTARREVLIEMAERTFEALRRGIIRPDVRHRYPLAAADDAHRDLEGRRTTGQVVLVP